MPKNEPTIKYRGFTGINNMDEPESLEPSELREAVNVDITRKGRARRRRGNTKVYSASDTTHSLFGNNDYRFFAEGTELKKLNPDYSASVLLSGITRAAPIDYEDVMGDVYWANGYQNGVIRGGVNKSWGIVPPGTPTLTAIAGALYEGTYQVAITFATTEGRESGARLAGTIELPTNGGVSITSIPVSTNPDVAYVNLYISPANGDQLYYAGQIANGVTTAQILGGTFSVPMRTQFYNQPPVGHLIAYCKGIMYVAVGNMVYFSKPYALEWFDIKNDYIPFPKDLTMMAPVEDGIYFSSDKTYWHPGVDPKEGALQVLSATTAIKGTNVIVPNELIGVEGLSNGMSQIWLNNNGCPCVGSNGGSLVVVKDDKAKYQEATIGTGLFRKQRGINQYIGLMRGSGASSSAYMSDVASVEVIRNGIPV